MRILKQLSLFICVIMLASQAHAMLRGCMGLVRFVPRVAPNMWETAGVGVHQLNGGMPPLNRGQQAAYPTGVVPNGNILQDQPMHYYTTMVQEDDEQEHPIREELRDLQAEVNAVFEGEEIEPGRDVHAIFEDLRTRVILDRSLLNFVHHVNLGRLAQVSFEDRSQVLVVQALLRHFQGRDSVGYTLFNEALTEFEEDPRRFLARLDASDVADESDVD